MGSDQNQYQHILKRGPAAAVSIQEKAGMVVVVVQSEYLVNIIVNISVYYCYNLVSREETVTA